MDMILFEVFLNNRYYNGTIYIIDNVIVLSDLVESSEYSSKTLQKGSCPHEPLDEVLWYAIVFHCYVFADLCRLSILAYKGYRLVLKLPLKSIHEVLIQRALILEISKLIGHYGNGKMCTVG